MVESAEGIKRLAREIEGGKQWYIALLEAIAMWTETEETLDGRVYRYLIAGEALDWLILAERLCESVDGLLPEEEKLALLNHGRFPANLTQERFRELIGAGKYRQHLNYFYGIVVEEALIQTVQEEVRKERWSLGFISEPDYTSEVYRRIYGATRTVLLKRFRRERKYPQLKSISLTELKEFTYWLFKYRLKQSDRCKVASDTKKALEWLKRQRDLKGMLEVRS